jgi:LysM repeat protein
MAPARKLHKSRSAEAGAERYLLLIALLVPLAVTGVVLTQLPGTSFASPSSLWQSAEDDRELISRRPSASSAAPPPTLTVPTPTPRPVEPAVAAVQPTATPQRGGTYTVQPGDELKHIATRNNVSIWKLISSNEIPDPDSLRVGQVLKIPEN